MPVLLVSLCNGNLCFSVADRLVVLPRGLGTSFFPGPAAEWSLGLCRVERRSAAGECLRGGPPHLWEVPRWPLGERRLFRAVLLRRLAGVLQCHAPGRYTLNRRALISLGLIVLSEDNRPTWGHTGCRRRNAASAGMESPAFASDKGGCRAKGQILCHSARLPAAVSGGLSRGSPRVRDASKQPLLRQGVAAELEGAQRRGRGQADLDLPVLNADQVTTANRCPFSSVPPVRAREPAHWFGGHGPNLVVISDGQGNPLRGKSDLHRHIHGVLSGCSCHGSALANSCSSFPPGG